MKLLMTSLMSVGVAAAMLSATPAQASDWANAVDVCQGSLPSFEGALRKRPLAIANEGAAAAFVSCSVRAPLTGEEVEGLTILLTNRSAGAVNVSCTLVDGVALPFPAYPPVYQPKSVPIAAGGFGLMQWDLDVDNGGTAYRIPNLNCALAPGVELNVVQMDSATPI